MIYITTVLVASLFFLLRLNFKYSNIKKHDDAMFKMAELRREVTAYLRSKFKSISKEDAKASIELIDLASYTISNHREFYTSLKFKDVRIALNRKKEGIEEAEHQIEEIHNKSIKSFYTKFGLILLGNISANTLFFKGRLIFTVVKFIAPIILIDTWRNTIDRIEKYFMWYDSKDSSFSSYKKKLRLH